jgi:transcriptional regulator with XRE-family HTH domain
MINLSHLTSSEDGAGRGGRCRSGCNLVGALLRHHRVAAGLTQEGLAELSGLSVRAISNIERARTASPYPTSMRLLADALKLPSQAFWERQLRSA